jgi:hypothetical protein
MKFILFNLLAVSGVLASPTLSVEFIYQGETTEKINYTATIFEVNDGARTVIYQKVPCSQENESYDILCSTRVVAMGIDVSDNMRPKGHLSMLFPSGKRVMGVPIQCGKTKPGWRCSTATVLTNL